MTSTVTKEKKEKRYHLVRKQSCTPAFKFFVRFLSILISLLFILLIFTLIGKFSFGNVVSYMFGGAFGSSINVDQTFLSMMMLLVLAIGLAPAYKMKFWNTGALGQALIGNLCSSLIVFYCGPYISNNFLLLVIALICAILGGAIWGIIPGFFKAKFNANETLFTLMMNYVAVQLVLIFIEVLKQGAEQLKVFEYGAFDPIGGNKYGWVYIIVVLIALFIFIYLKYTKHGYELAVLGESPNTAKYAGIDISKVTIRTSALSGGLCAICGFIFTASSSFLSTNSDGGFGFTSIIVTWSSHFSIIAMAVISFLISFLINGTNGVRNKSNGYMNEYANYIAVGIFLFFLIGCEFFLNFKLNPNSKLAKIREEKKAKFKEKHPELSQKYETFHIYMTNFFTKISNFFIKIKNSIKFGFEKVISAINKFFIKIGHKIKSLFSKEKGGQ